MKISHQSLNFDTFECSGENLPNSSFHFPNHKSVFLKILHDSSVSRKITPLQFFSSSIYFSQREPIKVQIFETFECWGQNLSNSSCQFWNKSISLRNYASFFIVMIHNPYLNLKLIHFLFLMKGSHQSPSFETFECAGENLPNFSCHYPNHKLVFLQILHDSPVSWKIIPLWFFSSNIIYFGQKERINVQSFETLESLDQNLSNT